MSTVVSPPSRNIPDAVIASLKKNTSIVTLLKRYGVSVKPIGNGHKAICPFHRVDGNPERTPSLSVDVANNQYHCFSCNESGDVISIVMKLDNLDFIRSVEKLMAFCPVPLYRDPSTKEKEPEAVKGEKKELPAPVISEETRQAILREVVRRSTEDLRNSEAGRKYLESRGLDPLSLLQSYSFGFCNGSTFQKLDGSEKAKLAAVGLLCGNNGSSRALFENCIVFPLIKDERIGTIYGRKTTVGSDESGRHYLLPHRREGLFLPAAGLNPRRPVIITESIIDGLSLFTAGIQNILPLLGVNGFLPDHLDYLKSQSFPMIHIALNGDEAGNRSAAALKHKLVAEGLSSAIIQLPEGKDINDMLREMKLDALHAWFTEQIGEKPQADDRPTVWEDDKYTYILLADREYRLHLESCGIDRLRVTARVCRKDGSRDYHIDKLDLYLARARETFVGQVAKLFSLDREIIARDVNAIITLLEELQLKKKDDGSGSNARKYQMSEEERQEALAYLKAPKLLERIVTDLQDCGIVGNKETVAVSYLCATSRLTKHPFGVILVALSGAGKSLIQTTVTGFIPEESLMRFTRLTPQSLFYQGKDGLRHRVLSIEEDEGLREGLYQIRTLLSSQRLSVYSLRTDPKSGEHRAYENVVEGPASVMISTTDLGAFDHETANRFFALYLDESKEQTRAIMAHQRRIAGLEGLAFIAHREHLRKLHMNIQRLLKPVRVLNRLGTGIEYPEDAPNVRRESTKAQALLESITLLHQYQRDVKTETVHGMNTQYIEVTKEDVALMHRCAGDILRQSLDNELSKLCRQLLDFINKLVTEKYDAGKKDDEQLQRWQVSFTRKELQDQCHWSNWHLVEHLRELVELGYITPRIGKQGQKYAYSLVVEGMPQLPLLKESV